MTQTATEIVTLADNVSGATNGPDMSILGGRYVIMSSGTLGTAPSLQVLLPNGAYWEADAFKPGGAPGALDTVDLPPGKVRVVLASGAANAYVYLARIPG